MTKKMKQLLLLIMILMEVPFSLHAIGLKDFNSGTAEKDWKSDYFINNIGIFKMIDKNHLHLELPSGANCVRYSCKITGLPPSQLQYLSFKCIGKNLDIRKGNGFRSYLRNRKLNYITSFSPAGPWKWGTGNFKETTVQGRFRVPEDGRIELVFEIRGNGGFIDIFHPKITTLPTLREQHEKSPVKLQVLPAQWLKNEITLLQDIPVMQRITLLGDANICKNQAIQLKIEIPPEIKLLGIEYKIPVSRQGKLHYPLLECIKTEGNVHCYKIPPRMLALLKPDHSAWNNELFLILMAEKNKGKFPIQLVIENKGKILCRYSFTAKNAGALPVNRSATHKFRVLIGYPLAAESSLQILRQSYARYWNSLHLNPESYLPVWFDQLQEDIQNDFRKNYTPGIMIAGTNSLPMFRTPLCRQIFENHPYPRLKNKNNQMEKCGQIELPAIPYVTQDPDRIIWDKIFPEEINYRRRGIPNVKFVCFDFEPHLWRSGFCHENRAWFAEHEKLSQTPSIEEIHRLYSKKWEKFRHMENSRIIERFSSAMKKHFSDFEFRLCTDPLSSTGQTSTWCGVNPKLSCSSIGLFQNMPYFSGAEFFDTVKINTRLLSGKHFPLIDPSEFEERFFRKYTPDKTAQNIAAAAGLNNIGIGFWHKDCLDGSYLLSIAKAFNDIAQIEDILYSGIPRENLQITVQNCYRRHIADSSDFSIEFPLLTPKLRYTCHVAGNKTAILLLNYAEENPMIVQIPIAFLPPGEYQVKDISSCSCYGTFNTRQLSSGILIRILPQKYALLRITPATGPIQADLTQNMLEQEISSQRKLHAGNSEIIQNITRGPNQLKWTLSPRTKQPAIKISSKQIQAEICPISGTVTAAQSSKNIIPIEKFGSLILETDDLRQEPDYHMAAPIVTDTQIKLTFNARISGAMATNPLKFGLDNLHIKKEILLDIHNNSLDYTISFMNRSISGQTMDFGIRLRNLFSNIRITGINPGISSQLWLHDRQKPPYNWCQNLQGKLWKKNQLEIPKHGLLKFDPAFIGVYFWQGGNLQTAEPLTDIIHLTPGKTQKYTMRLIFSN